MDVVNERLAVLPSITLNKGAHDEFEDGHCAMEVVAWLAGEGHTDAPSCASEVLRVVTVNANDSWSDSERQMLVPFLPLMVGTAHDGKDEARALLALNWLVSTYAPMFLDLAGFDKDASSLRELEPIEDEESSEDTFIVLVNLYGRLNAELVNPGMIDGSIAWRIIHQTGGDGLNQAQSLNDDWTAFGKTSDFALRLSTVAVELVAARLSAARNSNEEIENIYSVLTDTVRDVRVSLLELIGNMIDPAEASSPEVILAV